MNLYMHIQIVKDKNIHMYRSLLRTKKKKNIQIFTEISTVTKAYQLCRSLKAEETWATLFKARHFKEYFTETRSVFIVITRLYLAEFFS
jgi:hypothetical protein